MFTFIRAIVYASLFIGTLLIYVPARVLSTTGIVRPAIGAQQVAGMAIGTIGAIVAVWCILAFATIGRGTPMPLDPPRRLVIRGPYRFVRNPMYIGAALALLGAALFYKSIAMLVYTGVFVIVMHLFVVAYEEPTLRKSFGQDYDAYMRKVRRWLPRIQ